MPTLEVHSNRKEVIPAPRGPLVNAAWIIRHYHTDPDTGQALVTERWIRKSVPGKIALGYSMVRWYRDDVVAYYEKLRRAG